MVYQSALESQIGPCKQYHEVPGSLTQGRVFLWLLVNVIVI